MSTPFYDLASLVIQPSGVKAQKVYAQKPMTTDGQLTFSRASTATRVNASGLIETVASNVPRLDYTNSTCPKLLLEPSRTNLALQSSAFNDAAWTKAGVTLTSGQADPFGGTSAWKLELAAGSSYLYQPIGGTVERTVSIWMRADSPTNVGFSFGATTGSSKNITTTWQRYTFTSSETGGVQVDNYFGISPANLAKTLYIYHAQLEGGTYPTSIIPTTTAAVTRLADACSKTGISSLIGQTEGTLYWEGRIVEGVGTDLFIAGDITNSIFFNITSSNSLRIGIRANGTLVLSPSGGTVATNNKIALAYKSGDVVAYVNGVQVITDSTSFTFSDSISKIELARAFFDAKATQLTAQALIFKTRLTNAQLAELTAL
jgi:hypothetical protein